ncbi:MAG: class I SAM-dependent methyltransferase [Anaerolineales bacterium]|nr:MAG: class I SAM-dependent methyltransferase [Anaerolineales bacterium]
MTSDLNKQILTEQKGWSAPDSLEFYRSHRNTKDDLYESEKFFLPAVLQEVNSVLDVGCAAGGFSRIMKSFNPKLRYVGVDITPELIETARQDYPDSEFYVNDGVNFPFSAGSFDLVHCTGVLHVNSHYQEMLKAMWEQTNRYLLCDFRLTHTASVLGEIEIRFGENTQATRLPYYIMNVDELMVVVKTLLPAPALIRAKGYMHAVSPTAKIALDQVIMAFFLFEKGSSPTTIIELDLPGN